MNSYFKESWRSAAGLAAAAVLPLAAMAQTTAGSPADANPETQVLPAVTVTGSQIPGPSSLVAVPVTMVSSTDIASTGVASDVLDILRKLMPQFGGNANLGLENAGGNAFFSMGGSAISVHNLSTLVLINGRRVAFDPAEAAVGNQFVDVNMIPPSAIDRIEVLTAGASAIYGSDAVGGVVNIILKTGYNGWEAGVHWGAGTNHGHYSERSGYLTGGVSTAATSLLISVEGTDTDPVYMRDRPYTNPIFGSVIAPGVIDITSFVTGADTFYRLAPNLSAPPGGAQYSIDQLVAMGVYAPQSPDQVLYNLADQQTLVASLRRRSAVASFDHKIAGDRLALFGDVIYADTHTRSSVVAQAMTPYVSTPVTDMAVYGTTPPPPGGFAFFPYVPADQANNPFSPDWIDAGNLVTAHNLIATQPIVTQDKSEFSRLCAGLKGSIAADYHWQAAANFTRYHLDYANPGQVDTANLNAAFAAGTLNPFAASLGAAALPAGVIGARADDMLSTLNSFDFLVQGSPFDLPAGKLSFAAGASYTREHLEATPDANSLPNAMGIPAWLSYQSLSPFDASRSVTSLYAELRIPLFDEAQAVPGLRTLALDLAGRYDRYSGVGHSAVPQAGLLYKPFDDQFVIRASVGRSFAAPSLFELYGPVQSGQIPPITFDNYGGGQTIQARFNGYGGSNPDLDPAKASNWSAGFTAAPRALRNLRLSADYFQVRDDGEIGFLSAPAIVQSVELLGPASPFAQYVHIGGPGAAGVTAPGQLSTAIPGSVFVNVPLVNLASQLEKGFDVKLDWTLPTAAAGTFTVGSAVTAYASYRLKAIPTEGYFQYAGYATGGGSSSSTQGTIPRWRATTTVEWKFRGVDLLVTHTYVPSVFDIGPGGDAATPPVRVDAYQQVDASLAYDLARLNGPRWLGKLRLRVGANNVFNRMPPVAPHAFPDTNADVATYGGAIGRLLFVDAIYRF